MNRRVIVLVAALALLLAAGSYDARLAVRIVAARKAEAAMARRFSEIEGKIHLQGRPDSGFGKPATTRGGRDRLPEASASSAGKPMSDPKLLIAGDPNLRAKYLTSFHDGLDQKYGLYIRILGLSPTDASLFKQLMTEREANNLQVAETAADSGLDTDDPQMKALSSQLNQPSWQQLKELLGSAGIAELKQYWNEWPTVTLVQNFGGTLPTTNLTVAQAQDLLPVLSAASQRNANGVVIPDTINVTAAISAATPILSPEQLLTLSAMLQATEARTRISALSASK